MSYIHTECFHLDVFYALIIFTFLYLIFFTRIDILILKIKSKTSVSKFNQTCRIKCEDIIGSSDWMW